MNLFNYFIATCLFATTAMTALAQDRVITFRPGFYRCDIDYKDTDFPLEIRTVDDRGNVALIRFAGTHWMCNRGDRPDHVCLYGLDPTPDERIVIANSSTIYVTKKFSNVTFNNTYCEFLRPFVD
jgi:hypothetical protein